MGVPKPRLPKPRPETAKPAGEIGLDGCPETASRNRGRPSNYGARQIAKFVYLSATLEAATWGAELAIGEGRGRIYRVEPTGPIEDDPNVTDRKYPGNPTKSYRSRHPFRVVGEVTDWTGHSPERLAQMLAFLDDLKRRGVEAIEE